MAAYASEIKRLSEQARSAAQLTSLTVSHMIHPVFSSLSTEIKPRTTQEETGSRGNCSYSSFIRVWDSCADGAAAEECEPVQ